MNRQANILGRLDQKQRCQVTQVLSQALAVVGAHGQSLVLATTSADIYASGFVHHMT